MPGAQPPPPPLDRDPKRPPPLPSASASSSRLAAAARPAAPAERRTPYRTAFSAALSSALVAAVVVGTFDVILTLRSADSVDGREGIRFATVTLSLYLVIAVLVGVFEGLLAGAFGATHPGAGVKALWRKLASNRELDRRTSAWILAGLASGGAYLLAIALLGMRFVAGVERQSVGALVLGAAAVVVLPVFVFLAYPFYRVTRQIALIIPPLGPVPGTAVMLLVAVGFGGTVGLLFVTRSLDWRAIPLGPPLAALGFLVTQVVVLGVVRPVVLRRTSAIARRLALAFAILGVAILPVVTLSGAEPSDRVVKLLTSESHGAKVLVGFARRLYDRDGDGYSTLLGGGDCDDSRADVHPGAPEIPDDGIDQNCIGGDSRKAAGGGGGAAADPATPAAPAAWTWKGNVVIIAVDTLRADRLGVAGYKRDGKSLTPRIDALIERGVWFRRAYAQAPNTPRSFPSIFLSRYPSQIKWDDPYRNYSTVLPENLSVFEVFQQAKIATIGVASHFYFTAERGITQGFDSFDNEGAKSIKDSNHDVASPRIVPKVTAKLAELAASKQRFVLLAHLFEPHSTYMTHEGDPEPPSGEAGLVHKYDYEIAYVDRYVGELVDAIEKQGLADDTMVVLVSDHGEAFGVHKAYGERMFFHGQTLYDELLRVPVVFVAKGLAPRKVDTPVMLVDLAPTLVEAAGLPVPPEFQGRSLVAALAGKDLPPAPVHAELLPAPSWKHDARMRIDADGKTKVIYRVSDNLYELYDLAKDPEEREDLFKRDAKAAERMKQAIAAWMDSL